MAGNERKLTPAEERRQQKLNEVTQRLEEEGYTRNDLTIDLAKANVIISFASVPVFVLGIFLYYRLCGVQGFGMGVKGLIIYAIGYIVLIVAHELVHGLTWSFFSPNHWKDIDFGFIVKTMNPYCTCGEPLEKGQYILGAMMPLLVTGIIPTVIAFLIGSFPFLLVGLSLIIGAGGDIMLVLKLLRFRTYAKEILIYDHPTEAGSIMFTR